MLVDGHGAGAVPFHEQTMDGHVLGLSVPKDTPDRLLLVGDRCHSVLRPERRVQHYVVAHVLQVEAGCVLKGEEQNERVGRVARRDAHPQLREAVERRLVVRVVTLEHARGGDARSLEGRTRGVEGGAARAEDDELAARLLGLQQAHELLQSCLARARLGRRLSCLLQLRLLQYRPGLSPHLGRLSSPHLDGDDFGRALDPYELIGLVALDRELDVLLRGLHAVARVQARRACLVVA